MNLNLDQTVSIPPNVTSEEVFFGESLLMNTSTLVYFGLDALGSRIWALLGEKNSLREVLQALREQDEVSGPQLEQKFAAIIDGLRRSGLLELSAE